MEFRNCAEFVMKKGDRVYTLHIPPDATLGELLDVAFQMLEEARSRANAAVEKALPKEVSADKKLGE